MREIREGRAHHIKTREVACEDHQIVGRLKERVNPDKGFVEIQGDVAGAEMRESSPRQPSVVEPFAHAARIIHGTSQVPL